MIETYDKFCVLNPSTLFNFIFHMFIYIYLCICNICFIYILHILLLHKNWNRNSLGLCCSFLLIFLLICLTFICSIFWILACKFIPSKSFDASQCLICSKAIAMFVSWCFLCLAPSQPYFGPEKAKALHERWNLQLLGCLIGMLAPHSGSCFEQSSSSVILHGKTNNAVGSASAPPQVSHSGCCDLVFLLAAGASNFHLLPR